SSFPTCLRASARLKTRSPTWNRLVRTFLSKAARIFCLYSTDRNQASSRPSSIRSRASLAISSFFSCSKHADLCELSAISTGRRASIPYTIMNDDWPVELLGVVRYAHRTVVSSSIQAPDAFSSRFFSPCKMVLFVTSTCPLSFLACGFTVLTEDSSSSALLFCLSWDWACCSCSGGLFGLRLLDPWPVDSGLLDLRLFELGRYRLRDHSLHLASRHGQCLLLDSGCLLSIYMFMKMASPPAAISRAFTNLLLAASIAAVLVSGFQFPVGGKERGWKIPTGDEPETYNEWAAKNRFRVGDTIGKFANIIITCIHFKFCF
ncbi:early nodulin-like protein 6, partial [Striga hermonthica]